MNQDTALSTPVALPLSHPAYRTERRLRNWNGRMTALSCPDYTVASRLLKRELPQVSKETHLELARYHARRAAKLERIWSAVWRRAIENALGRAPQVSDYRITAIGNEAVDPRHHRALRHCAYSGSQHKRAAHLHSKLAAYRGPLETL